MMARADRLIREAEGKYERSKAHELQGKGNATGKLVEGELPDDAAERKALMDQALADRRKERLKYMTHDELIDDAAQFRGDMDEDERYALMERCARGEPMRFVEVPENSLLRRPLLPLAASPSSDTASRPRRPAAAAERASTCWCCSS